MFNAHAYSETWFKNGVLFSAGYMFDNLNENFNGSNIYGDDFDVIYAPNPLNGLGYTSLDRRCSRAGTGGEFEPDGNAHQIPDHRAVAAGAVRHLERQFQRHRDAGHRHPALCQHE